jgi:REP element-mobilizing transposase RayT
MAPLQPLYTAENCSFSAPLRWGLTIFWREPFREASWLNDLRRALEPDGIRLLGHRQNESRISQFSLSTLPFVAPVLVVKRVKGRLQYLVRQVRPRAFQRNYALRSVATATRQAVEKYVEKQLGHHDMADPRVETLFRRYQIVHRQVDLSKARSTAHAVYWYNLHVVLVHRERGAEILEEILAKVHRMIENVSAAKGYALARAGILPDHLHLALGCPLQAAPGQVALSFLNNLAYIQGMKTVYQYGAYVGTFGEYHQGAVVSDSEAGTGEEE